MIYHAVIQKKGIQATLEFEAACEKSARDWLEEASLLYDEPLHPTTIVSIHEQDNFLDPSHAR